MNYSFNPTYKQNYFGHVGVSDGTVKFRLRGNFLLHCLGTNQEHQDKKFRPNSSVLREIMTDAIFEGKFRKKMKKPHFLFGDKIKMSKDYLFDGNYKHQIRGRYMFLPNIEWSCPFSYPQAMSKQCQILGR